MIIQEAVAITSGSNYMPNRMRYRLPTQRNDVTIYLLSGSFEYDIELINNIPQPKMDYKNIIIPYKVFDKLGGRPFRYNMSMNEYGRKITYINNKKLLPRLMPIRYPYPSSIKENIYIPISDIIKQATPIMRMMSITYMKEHIFDWFDKVMKPFVFSKEKVIIIDVDHYKIYQSPIMENFRSDLINALLTAYVLNDEKDIKSLDYTIIFRNSDADYKFELSRFDKKDLPRLKAMLMKIGKPSELSKKINEGDAVANDSLSQSDDKVTKAERSLEDNKVKSKDAGVSEPGMDTSNEDDEDIKELQKRNQSSLSSLRDSIASLATKHGVDTTPSDDTDKSEKKLYDAKALNINAQLLRKINPNTQAIGNYKSIASDLTNASDNAVEKNLIDNAAKQVSGDLSATNISDAMNTTSSARELKIRQQVGQVKLNDVTFDSMISVTDTPLPMPVKPAHITTTNPGALKGSSFIAAAKEYEDKLMDRDIVATFMHLATLPDGFYVTDVEVTDISTVTSLVKNWRVTLKSKASDKQQVINIKVPKVVNGRFYNNGTWYNIGKQDFPIPILKVSKNNVIITTNYNKISVERYDTRSLVDISMLTKVLRKAIGEDGNNKYVRMGSSVNTNSRFESTIEYDEYAKQWFSFINQDAKCTIYFSRTQCLKLYGFVNVNENEFCCGMINQVPVILNTDTGLTRSGMTLTETMLKTLPPNYQEEYRKTKPGKMSMYAQINIGNLIPLGVAIAAWEGITQLLKRVNTKHQFVDKSFYDTKFFTIPFKDKTLAIPNTTVNQLIFNGFYRINTKAYNMEEFDHPIMESNSIFVDICNQLFFKQYSHLTMFITYYNFFVDAITKDVCLHYNIPDNLCDMLIYAARLLVDNSFSAETNASLYRVRSSEIIPGMIHRHLAMAISRYNNVNGSKSRDNKIQFNPNEIIQELMDTETVTVMSALNPMVELGARETVSRKGFRGVNSERAYTLERRGYDTSMVGKIAMSSSNNKNVGMNRQLVADPKIESVRGYTSPTGMDGDYNDMQLASFSELLTPGTITRDDAIRTTIATAQTAHIVSTADAQPVLISNGVDEIVPGYLTDEFSVIAEEDGKVLEIADDYMIIQYKSGKKRAINIGHRQAFNSGSGFYVDNKLTNNFEPNDSFVKGDILAYHEKFFNKDIDGTVRLNIGPLAKVAFTGLYSTYEDAGLVTTKMSKKLETSISMLEQIKLSVTDDIERMVSVGDEVEIGDPLIVFGLGDTGDKAVDDFLKAFQNKDSDTSILDTAKRTIKAHSAGKVVDIKIYTNKPMERLSPSLFEIVDMHFKENIRKRKILDKHDKSDSVYKLDTLYGLPTAPLKGNTIKGITCDILVEIYIEHADEASVGDKLVCYGASKQVLSEVIPEGLEPFAESDPNEEVSMFISQGSVMKRMIPGVMITAAGNKVLIELKRCVARLWEGK